MNKSRDKLKEREDDLVKMYNKVTGYLCKNYALKKQPPLNWEQFSDLTDFFQKIQDHWMGMRSQIGMLEFRNMDSESYRKEALLGELIAEVEAMRKRERRRERENK